MFETTTGQHGGSSYESLPTMASHLGGFAVADDELPVHRLGQSHLWKQRTGQR